MIFDFGKYAGLPVRDVPTGYLRWVARECDCADEDLLHAVREELRRRGVSPGEGGGERPAGHCPACERFRAEVAAQFRRLALACHPDRGGSDRAMAAVNDAYERLQAALR